jgi:hypothetical protein
MKMPYAHQAIVPKAKIVGYLLNLANENGHSKARFFLAFGFTIEQWEVMANALLHHASLHEVTRIEPRPPFGIHYVIEGILDSPDGRNPSVRVIWIVDEGYDIPRLVSAYPL